MTRRARQGEAQAWIVQCVRSSTADCLIWPFVSRTGGYGMVRHHGRTMLSHRVVLTEVQGPCPDGMEALHSCDEPLCCNPRHLSWGTHAQNMADRIVRGSGRRRSPHGEKHHKARLTELDVREIRRSALSTADLARRYGVSWTSLDAARRGKSWRYLDGEPK